MDSKNENVPFLSRVGGWKGVKEGSGSFQINIFFLIYDLSELVSLSRTIGHIKK